MSTKSTSKKAKLGKKSIAAITDQIESRMRQGDDASERRGDLKDRSRGSKGVFFWGAASGLALAVAAPLLGKQARPAARSAIKGGIVAGRYVRRVASSIQENVQDLSAEAESDLNSEQRSSDGEVNSKRQSN